MSAHDNGASVKLVLRERRGVWLVYRQPPKPYLAFLYWSRSSRFEVWRSPSTAGFQFGRLMVQFPWLRDKSYDGGAKLNAR